MSLLTMYIDASGVKDKLNGSSNNILRALVDETYKQVGMLAEYIKRDKLSGQVLKNKTGNLRNSVFPSIYQESPTLIVGQVSVDKTAPYGAYQEYGAHIPERYPVKAKALRWYVEGRPVFAMYARAFDLPPRPFMRPSLDEKSAEITAALQNSVNEAIKE